MPAQASFAGDVVNKLGEARLYISREQRGQENRARGQGIMAN